MSCFIVIFQLHSVPVLKKGEEKNFLLSLKQRAKINKQFFYENPGHPSNINNNKKNQQRVKLIKKLFITLTVAVIRG